MSSCYKPTYYNTKGKQTQWINDIHCTHDLWCSCDHVLKHLLLSIAERNEKIELTKEEKKQVLQCLTTTEEITTQNGDDGDLDEIGLDAIFAEELTEDAG
ncbi:hypothetical protein TTMV5_gp1 [Torque teno mini virus 5]|uniref:Hepatitis TT virus Orf2/Gyrovirus Vp2 N-terminal domain-containing protein n=1 Tax=Torque teno mini virus 5 TaxID=687373 RepID=Q9DUB5_9VIRU|nr:hypothetical protein TTMV5_gp1 [Torque teno mini virus 5]BAB19322.1 unnamed protein product [Torque teno mini virus 5]